MKKLNTQVINSLMIILGGALLLFGRSGEPENVYVLVVGLVLLMWGLYRATNHWVETKDDHVSEDEGDHQKQQ